MDLTMTRDSVVNVFEGIVKITLGLIFDALLERYVCAAKRIFVQQKLRLQKHIKLQQQQQSRLSPRSGKYVAPVSKRRRAICNSVTAGENGDLNHNNSSNGGFIETSGLSSRRSLQRSPRAPQRVVTSDRRTRMYGPGSFKMLWVLPEEKKRPVAFTPLSLSYGNSILTQDSANLGTSFNVKKKYAKCLSVSSVFSRNNTFGEPPHTIRRKGQKWRAAQPVTAFSETSPQRRTPPSSAQNFALGKDLSLLATSAGSGRLLSFDRASSGLMRSRDQHPHSAKTVGRSPLSGGISSEYSLNLSPSPQHSTPALPMSSRGLGGRRSTLTNNFDWPIGAHKSSLLARTRSVSKHVTADRSATGLSEGEVDPSVFVSSHLSCQINSALKCVGVNTATEGVSHDADAPIIRKGDVLFQCNERSLNHIVDMKNIVTEALKNNDEFLTLYVYRPSVSECLKVRERLVS